MRPPEAAAIKLCDTVSHQDNNDREVRGKATRKGTFSYGVTRVGLWAKVFTSAGHAVALPIQTKVSQEGHKLMAVRYVLSE